MEDITISVQTPIRVLRVPLSPKASHLTQIERYLPFNNAEFVQDEVKLNYDTVLTPDAYVVMRYIK